MYFSLCEKAFTEKENNQLTNPLSDYAREDATGWRRLVPKMFVSQNLYDYHLQ